MQVLKFGGSSVASAENINKIIDILQNTKTTESRIIVVSALGGITDLLINCANVAYNNIDDYKIILQKIEERHLSTIKIFLPKNLQDSTISFVKKCCSEIDDICNGIKLLGELSSRSLDKIMSYGELLSSQIIHTKLLSEKFDANWIDAKKLIKTDNNFGAAIVDFKLTNENIENYFSEYKHNVYIVPGFIASDLQNNVTTLGRGGSDYTAAIFASGVNASILEIWTDVSGMMTADPRIVQNVKVISEISYQDAMELSHFGAKVIYPPTIQPVMFKNIPVIIKNTFAPNDGGTIIKNNLGKPETTITGISSINKISLLSLEGSGMAGIPGFSKRLFATLANEKINVILISQSSSEHSICVAINSEFAISAKNAIDKIFDYEIQIGLVNELIVENNLAIIAIVGDSMQNHTGVAGKMFNTLGKNGINIRAIAQGSSERNISAIIAVNDVTKAVNVFAKKIFLKIL